MENNTLLYGVLKSLGYAVYATGGRVCLAATGQAKEGLERLYTGMYVFFSPTLSILGVIISMGMVV